MFEHEHHTKPSCPSWLNNWSSSYMELGHPRCRYPNQKSRTMRIMLGFLNHRFIGRFELLTRIKDLIIILRTTISRLFRIIRKPRMRWWFNGQCFQICCFTRYWIRINLPIHRCWRNLQISIIISQIQEHRIYWCYPKQRQRFISCCLPTTSLSRHWSRLTSLPIIYFRSHHFSFMRNLTRPRCLSCWIQPICLITILDC